MLWTFHLGAVLINKDAVVGDESDDEMGLNGINLLTGGDKLARVSQPLTQRLSFLNHTRKLSFPFQCRKCVKQA